MCNPPPSLPASRRATAIDFAATSKCLRPLVHERFLPVLEALYDGGAG